MEIFSISVAWNFLISTVMYAIAIFVWCGITIIFYDWWNYMDEIGMKWAKKRKKLGIDKNG